MAINLLDQRIVKNMKKRTNRKWTRTLNLHHLIRRRHRHRNQEWRKRKAQRGKRVLSDDSGSSDDSHYRRKRRNNKKHQKEDPIKLGATLTAKLPTAAYKSKIIKFKMDEDPLQRRIYFLTFIDIFTVQRNLSSSFRLSKNRRGWCYWRLCKKGYQKHFAWKHWCTQQNIDWWVPKRWNQIYW